MAQLTERRYIFYAAGKRLARYGCCVVLCYFGVIALFALLEKRLIYRGTRATSDWTEPANTDWQDIYLTTPTGVRIHAWWCPVHDADGALLYCHGNAGNLSSRHDVITLLQDQWHVSVLIFDYPGYGKSAGKPTEAGCYAAALTAYHWLIDNQNIPSDKLLIFGNSLGGGVASYVAEQQPHRALILSKTFTSLPDVGRRLYPWLPVRRFMRSRFDTVSRLKNIRQPVIITHGTDDSLIPITHAEQLFKSANEPKMYYPIPDGGHGTLWPDEFFQQVEHFLHAHCGS